MNGVRFCNIPLTPFVSKIMLIKVSVNDWLACKLATSVFKQINFKYKEHLFLELLENIKYFNIQVGVFMYYSRVLPMHKPLGNCLNKKSISNLFKQFVFIFNKAYLSVRYFFHTKRIVLDVHLLRGVRTSMMASACVRSRFLVFVCVWLTFFRVFCAFRSRPSRSRASLKPWTS